jgi:mRNA interferase HigB
MKIRLLKQATLLAYAKKHPSAEPAFKNFLRVLKAADVVQPADITAYFKGADQLGNNSKRIVFNLAHNKFRLIGKYHFSKTYCYLYVKWIGTHAAYTKLCQHKTQNQYTIDDF